MNTSLIETLLFSQPHCLCEFHSPILEFACYSQRTIGALTLACLTLWLGGWIFGRGLRAGLGCSAESDGTESDHSESDGTESEHSESDGTGDCSADCSFDNGANEVDESALLAALDAVPEGLTINGLAIDTVRRFFHLLEDLESALDTHPLMSGFVTEHDRHSSVPQLRWILKPKTREKKLGCIVHLIIQWDIHPMRPTRLGLVIFADKGWLRTRQIQELVCVIDSRPESPDQVFCSSEEECKRLLCTFAFGHLLELRPDCTGALALLAPLRPFLVMT